MKLFSIISVTLLAFVASVVSLPPGGNVSLPGRRSEPQPVVVAPASFPSGATHYWNMDEASGIRDDAVGATDLDEVTAVGSGTGKDSNAAQFDWNGTTFGSLSDGVNISIPSAYSLCAWFKFSSVAANQVLTLLGTSVGDGFAFGISYSAAADSIGFDYQEEGNLAHPITPNTDWHLVCVTATGTTVTIYLDGSSVATDTGATIDFSDWDTFSISGGNSGAMSGTVGLVDEVSFFDRALNSTEVSDMWNGGTGTFGP